MTKIYATHNYPGNNVNLDNLPPQAAAIVEEVRSKTAMTRDELLNHLEVRFSNSRQSPKHILSFYRRRLISEGFLVEMIVA